MFDGEPTGEVNGVCWKLMSAIAAAAGLVITWLTKRLDSTSKEVAQLHEARLQDRKDFEAQTNVLLSSVLAKKRGASP